MHLLKRHFATFETCSSLDPPLLRQRLFSLASPPQGNRMKSIHFWYLYNTENLHLIHNEKACYLIY